MYVEKIKKKNFNENFSIKIYLYELYKEIVWG